MIMESGNGKVQEKAAFLRSAAKKIILLVLSAAVSFTPAIMSVPVAQAANMVEVNGIKYVNGDTNLLVYSFGTGAGSYAALDTARMRGGTCGEVGLVVLSFDSGAFFWRIGQERVDRIESKGEQWMWWDPQEDRFFLQAGRKYELKENKAALHVLLQRAMKNSDWKGQGSQAYADQQSLRIKPKMSAGNKLYRQQIYTDGGNEVSLQVVQASNGVQKFMIVEKKKVVFSYDTPNIKTVQMGIMDAVKLGDRTFYAYTSYDSVHKVGHAILVGKSAVKGKYKIYLDSNNYYNPKGTAGYPIIGPVTTKGETYTGLRFGSHDYGNTYYKLLYDRVKDTVEYQK